MLRRKRFIEEKLKQADGQLENIEQLIQDIEFAQVEMKVSILICLEVPFKNFDIY